MTTLRQVLSCVFVGIYGAIAGTLLGWVATFWMWGIGFVLGLPVGLCLGIVWGWKMQLRDAVILLAGCLSSLVLVMWMRVALGLRPPVDLIATLIIVGLSGPMCRLVQQRLTVTVRYLLAWILTASCVLNIVLFIWIRA